MIFYYVSKVEKIVIFSLHNNLIIFVNEMTDFFYFNDINPGLPALSTIRDGNATTSNFGSG